MSPCHSTWTQSHTNQLSPSLYPSISHPARTCLTVPLWMVDCFQIFMFLFFFFVVRLRMRERYLNLLCEGFEVSGAFLLVHVSLSQIGSFWRCLQYGVLPSILPTYQRQLPLVRLFSIADFLLIDDNICLLSTSMHNAHPWIRNIQTLPILSSKRLLTHVTYLLTDLPWTFFHNSHLGRCHSSEHGLRNASIVAARVRPIYLSGPHHHVRHPGYEQTHVNRYLCHHVLAPRPVCTQNPL